LGVVRAVWKGEAVTVRAALYTRVSTDVQECENQRIALREVAEKNGWEIVLQFTDEGISGAKGRDERPGLDGMLKAAKARRFDMLMVWGVDRLSRSLTHLISMLAELDEHKIGLYLHQQQVDTSTPAGRMVLQMSGVFAEFERSMIRERIKAGLVRAKAAGRRAGPKGLESSDPTRYRRVKELLLRGVPPWTVGQTTKTGQEAVLRIKRKLELSGEL